MKLFIPACGDRLILVAPWTFDLYLEHRNMKFAMAVGLLDPKTKGYSLYEGRSRKLKRVRAALPAGTTLECDRVYIRTFSKSAIQVGNDFDSITWKVMKDDKTVRNHRFWVKLPDCYDIDYRTEVDSLYRDRVKAVKEVLES